MVPSGLYPKIGVPDEQGITPLLFLCRIVCVSLRHDAAEVIIPLHFSGLCFSLSRTWWLELCHIFKYRDEQFKQSNFPSIIYRSFCYFPDLFIVNASSKT